MGGAIGHQSYSLFEVEFKRVFDHSIQPQEAANRLLYLEFWNNSALRRVFSQGLSEQLKDELAVRNEALSLDSLISLAIHAKKGEKQSAFNNSNLLPPERSRRLSARESLYCGQRGHFIASSPLRPEGPKA